MKTIILKFISKTSGFQICIKLVSKYLYFQVLSNTNKNENLEISPLFMRDCIIRKCVCIGFQSDSLTSKRSSVWGLMFNISFGIMKTSFSWSVRMQGVVQSLFQHPRSTIVEFFEHRGTLSLMCLWDNPKPMQVHQEQKIGAVNGRCGSAPW